MGVLLNPPLVRALVSPKLLCRADETSTRAAHCLRLPPDRLRQLPAEREACCVVSPPGWPRGRHDARCGLSARTEAGAWRRATKQLSRGLSREAQGRETLPCC